VSDTNEGASLVLVLARDFYEAAAGKVREVQDLPVPPWAEADKNDVLAAVRTGLAMFELSSQIVETARARQGMEKLEASIAKLDGGGQ
jgi:hypothetical protein